VGRLRAAVAVLLGRQQTPVQIMAEWAEMKADFLDSYQKLNALVARLHKAQKALAREQHQYLEATVTPRDESLPNDRKARKQALRRRLWGGQVAVTPAGPSNGAHAAAEGPRFVPADEEREE